MMKSTDASQVHSQEGALATSAREFDPATVAARNSGADGQRVDHRTTWVSICFEHRSAQSSTFGCV